MRNLLMLSFCLLFFSAFVKAQDSTGVIFKDTLKHSFVGAETCGMCHKTAKLGNQFGIWKSSNHSKAYQALQTEKADSIAASKGYKLKASMVPQCLKCHTSGFDLDKKFLKGKFKVEDGVQCETCHGPGEDYKTVKIMSNIDLAVANGLWMHDDNEKFCIKCHNSESPTFKEFSFTEMWEKIKHKIPVENK